MTSKKGHRWRGRRSRRALRHASVKLARAQRRIRVGLSSLLARLRRGEQIFVIVTAILIGVLGGYGAIGFRAVIALAHQGFFGTSEYSLAFLAALPWWRRVLLPSVGGLLVGLIVTRLAPEVKGSGIPEVMEAVARRGGAIRLRVLATKAVAAALTIGSGGSAGREGPIVHIGSAIGSAVGQLLEVSSRRLRTFVACGAAAGIAATFNAPIAGALFAVEVVLGDLGLASLSPIVISSVVATVVSRAYLGDFPAFRVPHYEFIDPRELLLYAGMGLAAGLVAVAFTRLLYLTSDHFDGSRLPAWMRPAVGGLGVGLISLALPNVYGVGYETINAALLGKLSGLILAALVVAKLVATSLSLGSGGSGGVFAPSLFMGATLGAAWGHFAHDLFPSWTATPGAYALVGMGAVVAAATHAPITAILIIFELTNDYHIIPPLMISCVIGVLLSSVLLSDSIYTAKLTRRGVRLAEGRDVNLLRGLKVAEVMNPAPATVPAGLPFSELLPRLLAGPHPELMVVDGEHRLLGSVALADVRAVLPQSDVLASLVVAADAVHGDLPLVVPGDNLDLVMHLLGRTHRDEVPVVADPRSRRLVGTVTRDAVIDAYNRRIFQLDLTGGFGSLVKGTQGGRMVEVMAGVYLTELEAPFSLVGRTLGEADLRRRYGVEVVLINGPERSEGSGERSGRLPTADRRIEAGDRLLVMGTREAIERIRGD